MFDCENGIYIDVQSYGSSRRSPSPTRSTAGNFVNANKFNPGGAGNIVVVRLFYQWPIFVTGLGFNIANLTGGKRLLTATAAFKNEPL